MRSHLITRLYLTTILVVVSACGGVSPYRDLATGAGNTPDAVYFLIDTSGSMDDRVQSIRGGSERKIDVAVRSVRQLAQELASSSKLALRSYPDPSAPICDSGILRSDLRFLDSSQINRSIDGLRAGGATPTAEALRAAATDIRRSGQPATLILLSDGFSTCEDPCSAAAELDRSTDWTVITIGFDLGNSGSDELACIADVTGGRYINASDGAALEELFSSSSQLFSVTGS